jgi:hypothetical protein
MKRRDVLSIGDIVSWSGSFGTAPARPAKVTHLEITSGHREKYGTPVDAVAWTTVRDNRVLVSLDNGSWAYGEQIRPLEL